MVSTGRRKRDAKILLPQLQAKQTQDDIVAWIRDNMPPWAEGAVHAFDSINEAVLDVLHRHTVALAKADLVRPRIPDIQLPRS